MSYPPPTLTLPPLGRGDLNRLIDFWNGYTRRLTKYTRAEKDCVEKLFKALSAFKQLLYSDFRFGKHSKP